MSLRARTIEQPVTLPDGREGTVSIGMAHDAYLPPREEETVVLELRFGRHVEAALNTVLDPEHEREATALVQEIVEGLEAGRIKPTAAALEQYADRLP